ncbi:MAG TPA: maleylpyruvate isomerase family mycothiol-dependent enzyme [Acidimicrobiales bacterium]|nr:maleylpyruvate isomerase family mycothiol-dependent enzyme [Acidimicrobiales bacterium]
MSDDWAKIQVEREACADLFESLTPEQWASASLCKEWTVRVLAGHLIAATESSPSVFFSHLAKAGFSFNKMVDTDAKRCSSGDPAGFAGLMRSGALRRNHPPGPVTAMLGEAVIHGEDIRRPLGLSRDIPEASLVAVADFYKESNLIVGAKRRISGLRLKATDAPWTNGDGPEVTGTLASLILVMTGRREVCADLSGEGVAALQARP